MQTPDGFKVLEFTDDGITTYHIFSSWSGSYLYGDSWKRSSPVVSISESDGGYIARTMSGSEYFLCTAGEDRISAHNLGVLNEMLEINKGKVSTSTLEKLIEVLS